MIKNLEGLSQIIVASGISSSQEEQILTAVKNLSASQGVIKEQKIHESQEDIHSCNNVEETKESWTTSNGEQPLEPKIEEFLACLSTYPLRTQEDNHLMLEDLHCTVKEDMLNDPNNEVNQEHFDFLKVGFKQL